MVRLPTIQIVGAQKAGTSAIAKWLFDGGYYRPLVFDGEPWYYSKEAHFFDIDWNYNRGLESYASRFFYDESPALDATPDTLAFAQRVRDTYERAGDNQVHKLKIIVILRDPVSRELSLYNHLAYACRKLDQSELTDWHKQVARSDGTIMTFNEFVRDVTMPALATNEVQDLGKGRSSRYGLYANHLKEWFRLFNRNQILVLSYDELCTAPERVQDRIQRFIGRTISGSLQEKINSNDSEEKFFKPSAEVKQCIETFMKAHNERLYQLLEENPGTVVEQRPFPRFHS
mmetsp:Transcript_824/g.1253  ORF Transcript_824/g.1253 Transcript_824/m.1253 type:complete len:287 (-) Transcript_824:57-917(-)